MSAITDSSGGPPTERLTVHVGDEAALLDRLTEPGRPRELVIIPGQIHRRTVRRRLDRAEQAADGVDVTDLTAVVLSLARASETAATSLDRIDRLGLFDRILDADLRERIAALPGSDAPGDPQTVEHIRTEIEAVTNYHPERITAAREVATTLPAPCDADAADLVDVALTAERALARRTESFVSRGAQLRRVTRQLQRQDGAPWTAAYPTIDRVSVAGVSTVAAPMVDLLAALLATTSVSIDLTLREATGRYLESRLSSVFDVETPGQVVMA
jgi:ATP-dependent helicase/nuclease subunit B